ncbi:MAG TPA: chitobiase/beta-hexosaminidase C-terminal domain-containing protein [Verrucomicrobiae bacterium]
MDRILMFSLCAVAQGAWAQAPGLLWRTNIGAAAFAVDAQTNVYANTGGTVFLLSSAGVPLQTNVICPLPGIARRDSIGNFYFAGTFDGTQNFGGITLVGGWINFPSSGMWTPGYPTCFLAKYGSNANLQWVVSFGSQGAVNTVTDLALDPAGGFYIAFNFALNGAVAHLSDTGASDANWTHEWPGPGVWIAKLGGATASNCVSMVVGDNMWATAPVLLDRALNRANLGSIPPLIYPTSSWSSNAAVTTDRLGNVFQAGVSQGGSIPAGVPILRKMAVAADAWRVPIIPDAQWTLASDSASHVYLAGENGLLAQYDTDGVLTWSNYFGQPCMALTIDASGNRFASFADGTVARLGGDSAPQTPAIITAPQSATVFVGDSLLLSVLASGTPPLRYQWQLQSTNLPDATTASLSLSSLTAPQAGAYRVIVTNSAGSVTSAPAVVRVKSVELYLGSQLLTNGTYTFTSPPTLTVRSAFSAGSSFYTLDGSPPSFASLRYSGPFAVSRSTTVRAIGYSADFFQWEEADPVNVILEVRHTLTLCPSGGGSISLNPPGGKYPATNVVTATAVPDNGYSFLYWLGDASGTGATASVSMERDKTVGAVFGTTLSTTVAGNGQVLLSPPGGLYAYGSTVRLTALPQAGNYFGSWGNAASGDINPLYFTVTTPSPTVSSIFGATPAGQAALTIMITGDGRVSVSPRANTYSLGQSIVLTASPDTGQSFLGWTGDATGSQNLLTLSMNQSRLVTASFTARPRLSANRPGLEGKSADGFRFTLVSDPQTAWQIQASTNLVQWDFLAELTNTLGEAQFLDTEAVNPPGRFYRAAPPR